MVHAGLYKLLAAQAVSEEGRLRFGMHIPGGSNLAGVGADVISPPGRPGQWRVRSCSRTRNVAAPPGAYVQILGRQSQSERSAGTGFAISVNFPAALSVRRERKLDVEHVHAAS